MAITAQMVNDLRQKTGAGMMDCKRALTETGGDIDKAIVYLREKGMASASKKSARVAAEGKVEIGLAPDGRSGVMAEINCETDFVARGEVFQGFCARVAERLLASSETGGEQPALVDDLRKEAVSKTGENVVVRRFQRFALPAGTQGRVEAYLHMGGKIGVLIELGTASDKGAGAEALAEFAREMAMQVAAANPQYVHREQVPAGVLESERDIYRKQVADSGKPANVVEKIVEGRLNKYFAEFCLIEQPYIREQKQTVEQVRRALVEKVGEEVGIRCFARFQLGEGIEKKSTDLAAEVQAQIAATKKG